MVAAQCSRTSDALRAMSSNSGYGFHGPRHGSLWDSSASSAFVRLPAYLQTLEKKEYSVLPARERITPCVIRAWYTFYCYEFARNRLYT
jgi:hypothetical protein